jgi:ABC-type lipoprotein export system ATPase subunit
LVDEPTAHLDAVRGRVALELLRELSAELNAALLVATHDPLVLNSFSRQIEVAAHESSVSEPSSEIALSRAEVRA